MSERDYRIEGREWEPLPDERVEDILNDTGADCPAGDYCAADVYALAREVRRARRDEEDFKALVQRCEAWKALAEARDQLLVCYRVGTQPSGKLLDAIRKLKERLGLE